MLASIPDHEYAADQDQQHPNHFQRRKLRPGPKQPEPVEYEADHELRPDNQRQRPRDPALGGGDRDGANDHRAENPGEQGIPYGLARNLRLRDEQKYQQTYQPGYRTRYGDEQERPQYPLGPGVETRLESDRQTGQHCQQYRRFQKRASHPLGYRPEQPDRRII